MYFKQFLHDDSGCSSYLIASRESREAAIIDAQLEIEPYLQVAHDRDYRIVAAIDTHLHADHVSGNRALARATGAKVYLHAAADVSFPFTAVSDGDEVILGRVILKVVHTPGHRPEAISLLITNPPRSPAPSMVLSGDTLFVGDVGRPDFGGEEGALQQYESTRRLLRLEDWVEVFPAHFEGSCGKAMCGRPSSTIGFERRFNPVLQLPMEEFVRVESDAPARPLNMTAIMDANRGLAEYPWPIHVDPHSAPVLAAADAPAWIAARRPPIVDVREPAEYQSGHLPHALSLPQADLATRLSELPREGEFVVVCAGGVRSARAVAFLQSVGFAGAISLEGGTDAWRERGLPLER